MNDKNKSIKSNSERIEITRITPHNKAIYEAGKAILIDSIETGREFCKSMISSSMGAIPVYLGILAFIIPENYKLTLSQEIIVSIPAFIFLLSTITFTLGYLPITRKFSLDIVEDIEAERTEILTRRNRLILAGVVIFSLGASLAIIVVIFLIRQ